MYYDYGFQFLTLGIAIILAKCSAFHENDYYNDDPRIAEIARTRKFSCKEEIQRYLYHLDENAS